jgi:hypothetical protein
LQGIFGTNFVVHLFRSSQWPGGWGISGAFEWPAGGAGPHKETVDLISLPSRAILGALDTLVDIGVLAEKEVIQ